MLIPAQSYSAELDLPLTSLSTYLFISALAPSLPAWHTSLFVLHLLLFLLPILISSFLGMRMVSSRLNLRRKQGGRGVWRREWGGGEGREEGVISGEDQL